MQPFFAARANMPTMHASAAATALFSESQFFDASLARVPLCTSFRRRCQCMAACMPTMHASAAAAAVFSESQVSESPHLPISTAFAFAFRLPLTLTRARPRCTRKQPAAAASPRSGFSECLQSSKLNFPHCHLRRPCRHFHVHANDACVSRRNLRVLRISNLHFSTSPRLRRICYLRLSCRHFHVHAIDARLSSAAATAATAAASPLLQSPRFHFPYLRLPICPQCTPQPRDRRISKSPVSESPVYTSPIATSPLSTFFLPPTCPRTRTQCVPQPPRAPLCLRVSSLHISIL